jgi:hypothetical protein
MEKIKNKISHKKEKLFDNPVVVSESPFGSQRIYRFPNGYGASVVRIPLFTYTNNNNEWELAVIRFKNKRNDKFELCYDTPITDDVIGYLEEADVEKILHKIQKLPPVK